MDYTATDNFGSITKGSFTNRNLLMRLIRALLLSRAALASGILISLPTTGAEGMWTLDNLPREDLEKTYSFTPTQAWLDKSMRSAVRLAGGCSGPFFSP